MRNVFCVLGSAVALGSFCVGSASAAVVFQDDFEANAVGTIIGPPAIGSWVEGAGSGPNGAAIVGSPALGTRSMRITRESAPPLGPSNGDMSAISIPGTVVHNNVVEVKWSHNLEHVHRFNNPMQIAIGQVGSNFNNDFTFILIDDSDSGSYDYYSGPAQYGVPNSTTVQPSLNTPGANEGRWDAFRAVLTFNQLSPTQMGGSMDLFVSLNGGAEIQLANDATLFTSTIPGVDPTNLQMRIVKGPFSGLDFYDDISMEVVGVVPEPSMGALGLAALGLLTRRTRK